MDRPVLYCLCIKSGLIGYGKATLVVKDQTRNEIQYDDSEFSCPLLVTTASAAGCPCTTHYNTFCEYAAVQNVEM